MSDISKEAFITGGTGAIGMALTDILLSEGWQVTEFIRPASPRRGQVEEAFAQPLAEGRLQLQTADLADLQLQAADLADLKLQAAEGKKPARRVFFHLGWSGTTGADRADRKLQETNAAYALDAVRLARRLGCDTWLGAGSQAEYGPRDCALDGNVAANPVTEYGRAKLKAGEETRSLCQDLGMKHIWCRILSVYGPYDGAGTMVTATIRKLLMGERPTFTAATQIWDYVYAEDAAGELLAAAESGKNGRIYCVGSGSARPLKDYIEDIRDAIDPGLELGIGEIPYPPDAVGRVMHLECDLSDLTQDTGFRPRVTFAEGIRRTIDWNRKVLAKRK